MAATLVKPVNGANFGGQCGDIAINGLGDCTVVVTITDVNGNPIAFTLKNEVVDANGNYTGQICNIKAPVGTPITIHVVVTCNGHVAIDKEIKVTA